MKKLLKNLNQKRKKMIKIDIDETIVNNFYNGVKEYIGKHLFTSNPEKDYFTDEKIEEIIKCKINDFKK
jgi:predicted secreted acid phosphatase